jgi:hypothetical protein
MTQLICNLSSTLDVDHRKALNDFTSNMSLDEAIETRTQHEQALKSVTAVQYLLDAQKIAVELLTNMCSDDGMLWFCCTEKGLKYFFDIEVNYKT